MFLKPVIITCSLLASALLAIPAADAETLGVQSATQTPRHVRRHVDTYQTGGLPSRGMSMGQVERRFGAPTARLPAAGGDAPRHPIIHRWRYAGYTVYFERNHVITSVADSAPASRS